MEIYIASDHAGLNLKNKIYNFLSINYKIEDMGPYKFDLNDDYPDFAIKVCEKVLETNGKGILICGSGQGMDRVANKFPGIYAEVCWDEDTAHHAIEHSNANVLCFGEKKVNEDLAKILVKIWLETPFKNEERHIRRSNKIKAIERRLLKI